MSMPRAKTVTVAPMALAVELTITPQAALALVRILNRRPDSIARIMGKMTPSEYDKQLQQISDRLSSVLAALP